MGIFDDAVPGGNISKPLMIALGALLVGKLLSGKGAPDPAAPQDAQASGGQASDGGLLGGLGGLLGGAAGGGVGGGLGGLLGKLTEAGQGSAVDSWVKPGSNNQPIDPGHLGNALGSQTISDLAARAGMSEDELLQQLSRVLPGVVDKLTPQGQVPDQSRIAALLQS